MSQRQTGPAWLLAKSRRPNRDDVTLESHLLDTEASARHIFGGDTRWRQNWCRFFGLTANGQHERFLANLYVASLFHDIGKANEDFYAAVSQPGYLAQALRHEHLSGLILCLPAVEEWLSESEMLDVDLITAAVLSHHLKVRGERDGDWAWCQPSRKPPLNLYLNHAEVTRILGRIRELAKLRETPALPVENWDSCAPWDGAFELGLNRAAALTRSIRRDKNRLALLLATKAGVIVADSVASGLVREGHPIERWIGDNAHTPDVTAEDIEVAILKPCEAKTSNRTQKPFKYHDFQKDIGNKGRRLLLLAACAAGKTLAAWKWAAERARDERIGRVIFLYPTRGTATEGFRDYVGWAPEGEAMLLSGTSKYELEAMQDNPPESAKGKMLGLTEPEQRLFALGLWSKRYFSATVDQFLGFIEHSYSSMCLLPALADSAVIIDEVHSFDQRLFKNLVSFLKHFDVPVLCMTATLPPCRQDELQKAGLDLFQPTGDGSQYADLAATEAHPRYEHQPITGRSEAMRLAVRAYEAGERVLWVVNRVAECQRIACELENELKSRVTSYHSRFKLEDRKSVHEKTVCSFQQIDSPAIAVTTQVCEMSLDLDADTLISEVAPVPSLIQRFGRANRHLARGLGFRARLATYEPKSIRPYSKEEMTKAREFLSALGTGDVSQRTLAELMMKHSLVEPKADGSSRFLESGFFATAGSLRDIDEHTYPCILDSDKETVERRLSSGLSIDGFIVAVPAKYANRDPANAPRLPKYLGIANGEYYSTWRGFDVGGD
ncbi:MAG TPA: CRISPR-associated helicase Cas3' [Blastocatellia bacterium]|nr:CRISPR-associated helicase Cas3' [Blastocatellia bacterium]